MDANAVTGLFYMFCILYYFFEPFLFKMFRCLQGIAILLQVVLCGLVDFLT
jgi:hypothetical protein